METGPNPFADPPRAEGQPGIAVLFAGCGESEARAVLACLARGGVHVAHAGIAKAVGNLADAIGHGHWDVAFASTQHGDYHVQAVRTLMAHASPALPVIAVAPRRSDEALVDALRAGASDLVSPGDAEHLVLVLGRELERSRGHAESGANGHGPAARAADRATAADASALVLFGRFAHASAEFAQLLGFDTVVDLVGRTVAEAVAPADEDRVTAFVAALAEAPHESGIEIRADRGRTDAPRLRLEFVPLAPDGPRHFRVTARRAAADAGPEDAVARLSLARRLSELNDRDHLSGFYNRARLRKILVQALARHAPVEVRSFLVLVELEQLEAIRHSCGITATDVVVRDFSVLLRRLTPDAWVHARVADATFAVVLRGGGLERAKEVGEEVRRAVRQRIWDAGAHSVTTACSVGVVALDGTPLDADVALVRADRVCRAAREAGGDRVLVDALAEDLVPDDPTLAITLREALQEDRLRLVFQPIVGLRAETHEIYEVYLRAYDRVGRVLPMQDVFRVAETEGLSVELDKWVISQVAATIRAQHNHGEQRRFFVKTSGAAVRDPSMLLHLRSSMWHHRVSGEHIVVEIGESTATRDMRAARNFAAGARALGCSTALASYDGDAGSRGLLRWLDLQYVKIRPALTAKVSVDEISLNAVRAIQDTARSRGMSTIATHVQQASSLALLWDCGVDYVQGNYLHEPTPVLSAAVSE